MPHPEPDRSADPQWIRLFVALDIPEEVRRSISDVAAQFHKLCRSARWVRLEGAHVTLKFIGWFPLAKVEKLSHALAVIPVPASFDLRFAGLGFFPSERRPRVFWAGIEDGPELPQLAAAIESALVPLGIPKESRDFQPHLTLARFPEPPRGAEMTRLSAAVAERAADEFGRVRIDQFHLYQSVLKREGAEYTRLSSYPLLG